MGITTWVKPGWLERRNTAGLEGVVIERIIFSGPVGPSSDPSVSVGLEVPPWEWLTRSFRNLTLNAIFPSSPSRLMSRVPSLFPRSSAVAEMVKRPWPSLSVATMRTMALPSRAITWVDRARCAMPSSEMVIVVSVFSGTRLL